MSRHRRVVWSEGMLLSPQHLQQWDRHIHHATDERLRALQPFASGFTHLKLDRDQLRNGRMGILEARGVLPDGTAFAIPEDDPAPAPRAIGDHFGARQESVLVLLGVPSARAGRAQLGEAGAPCTPGPRYTADAVELADDNDSTSARPVSVARRNLCILFPEDALDEHDLLPATELTRTGQGSYAPREDYVPPCLAIGASDILMKWIETLHQRAVTKSDVLGSLRAVRGDLADFTRGNFAEFGQLLVTNASIPMLGHFVQSHHAHPEAVFELLVSLAGELCTFSSRVSAKQLPRYDHQALGPTFKELYAVLLKLLDVQDEQRWQLIALEKRDSLFVGQIKDPRLFEREASFFLAAAGDFEKDRLLRELPREVKVASQSQIDTIVELALPGVQMEFVQDLPIAIPPKPSFFYFKLKQSGDAWDSIKGSKNVAIFAPANMPGLSFELVGLRE